MGYLASKDISRLISLEVPERKTRVTEPRAVSLTVWLARWSGVQARGVFGIKRPSQKTQLGCDPDVVP